MANQAIRDAAKQAGVKLWEVAGKCGMTDSTFSRQLRRELPIDKQQQILSMIDELVKEKDHGQACL